MKLTPFSATWRPDVVKAIQGISASLGNITPFAWTLLEDATADEARQTLGVDYEIGSNANGEYVKFADGTLICWARINPEGDGSACATETWTFPASFSTVPRVTLTRENAGTSISSGSDRRFIERINGSSTTSAFAQVCAITDYNNPVAGDVFSLDIIAIGRGF